MSKSNDSLDIGDRAEIFETLEMLDTLCSSLSSTETEEDDVVEVEVEDEDDHACFRCCPCFRLRAA